MRFDGRMSILDGIVWHVDETLLSSCLGAGGLVVLIEPHIHVCFHFREWERERRRNHHLLIVMLYIYVCSSLVLNQVLIV